MMAPSWIMDIFAAIMLVCAAVSAVRLVTAHPWRRAAGEADLDAAHLLMGISMAGMLAPSLRTLPAGAWEVIFGVLTAWFAWPVYREARGQRLRVLADGHHAPHLVHSAAMLYMFAAPAVSMAGGSGSGMGGMGGTSGLAMPALRLPVVALLFALWLSAYVVLDLDRLSGPGHAHGSYFAWAAAVPAGALLAGASAAGGHPATATAAPSVTAPGSRDGGQQPAAGAGSPDPGRGAGNDPAAPSPFLLSPRVAVGCRIAMGVTMALMLVIMI